MWYERKNNSKGDGVIYQELPQMQTLLENQPDSRFYANIFAHLDVKPIEATKAKEGRPSEKVALFRSFIVMKNEKLSKVSELLDYLKNNLIIAHLCGFDITKSLPSYWTFRRYVRNIANNVLKEIMKSQVLELVKMKLIDGSFIGLDATPNIANTKLNNPKSFIPNKFDKNNHPKSDKDCSLGVHTASNQHTDRNYEFYWGYKNHILIDCITGLPIYEMTTGAQTADSSVAVDILKETNAFLSLDECYFIADAGYDIKEIYNTVRNVYHGDAFIPINPRNTKNPELLPAGNPICEAGFAMNRNGKCLSRNRTMQKFACPFKRSKISSCPINHPKWVINSKRYGCTIALTIPDDYRLSIVRSSKDFKDIYKLRTECERYNSRFKATGQERLWVRNFASVQNLNSFAHIAILASAIAAIKSQSDISYRAFSSLKRFA
jgi:IS5 family transposase